MLGDKVGCAVGDFVGDGVGGEVGLDDGDTTGESVGLIDGRAEGTFDGVLDKLLVGLELGRPEGRWEGSDEGAIVGNELGKFVGLIDGSSDGYVLGIELGSSDGTALAQVSQHMTKTVSNEHLSVEFSFAAHAQSCWAPASSGTSKVDVPAASPVQEVQQLSQQLTATSGSAHLNLVRWGSLIAQTQFCFVSIPVIENLAVVASPVQADGHEGGNDSSTIGCSLDN